MINDIEKLPKISEEFIVSGLSGLPEFNEFYETERNKIGLIHWVQDPALPKGITARNEIRETGALYIYLSKIPVTLEDAAEIAHEIQHFILNLIEGFPVTYVKDDNFKSLSSALNSMIQDPLVDSRLQTYGLVDLGKKYEKEVERYLRFLKKHHEEPSDPSVRTYWIFAYVGKMLDWELARSKGYRRINKFKLFYDKKYKNVALEAKKLLSVVKEIGYDTPEKQTKLFREIIQRYNLKDNVFLTRIKYHLSKNGSP